MNPVTLPILATAFQVGGGLLGLPSLAALIAYAALRLYQRLQPTPGTPSFGPNPDALLLMLQGITQVVGGIARLIGSLAQLLFDLAAMAAGAGLIIGLLCWLTGRGLQAHATWARFSAGTLLTLMLLVAGVLLLSVTGTRRLAMGLIVLVVLLGIHAVWVGHRP